MNGRNLFNQYRKPIYFLASLLRFVPRVFLLFLWDINSVFGNKLFVGIRYIILKALIPELGDNVYVGKYVVIKNHRNIRIRDNVSIHDYSYVDGLGGLQIGNNVSIAHNCSILTTNHKWSDKSIPIKYNREELGRVEIMDDVWLGCGVRVLAGVTIGNRSIVGAGAIVTKDVGSNALVGGVPAKLLKVI